MPPTEGAIRTDFGRVTLCVPQSHLLFVSGVLAGTTAIGVRHRVAVRVAGSQPRAAPVRWRHDTDQAASLKARVCGRLAAPWNAEGYHFGVSLCVDLETLCCVWVIWVSYLRPKRLIGIFDSVGRRAAQNHPPVARELAQRGDLAAGTSEGNRFVKADHPADIAQKPKITQ